MLSVPFLLRVLWQGLQSPEVHLESSLDLAPGTTPAPPQKQQGQGPLDGVDPGDPGVDISSVIGKSSAIWSKMAGE